MESSKKEGLDSESSGVISGLSIFPEKLAAAKYFDIENGQVVVLKKGATIYLDGIAKISVFTGMVEVLGYILKENTEYVVNSPKYTHHLYIKNKTENNKNDEIEDGDFPKSGLTLGEFQKFKDDLTDDDAILICRRYNNEKYKILVNHFKLKLFPKNENGFLFEEDPAKLDVVDVNEEWSTTVDDVKESDGSFKPILVVGAKKTGKGLLSRYLTNNLLQKYEKVLMIDLDPAQTEFTVSGSISAVVISQPLLGPNYMNLKIPDYSVFVGIVDLSQKCEYYLKCVEKLLSYCDKLPKMPIVIQFNGFTGRIAFNLISGIICLAKPKLVIELYSNIASFNFEQPVTPENVEKHKTFTSTLSVPNFKVYRFESINNERAIKIDSKVLRIMRLVMYFLDTQIGERTFFRNDIRNFVGKGNLKNGLVAAVCKETNTPQIYDIFGWAIITSVRHDQLKVRSPYDFAKENEILVFPEYFLMAPKKLSPTEKADLYFARTCNDDDEGFKWYSKYWVRRSR